MSYNLEQKLLNTKILMLDSIKDLDLNQINLEQNPIKLINYIQKNHKTGFYLSTVDNGIIIPEILNSLFNILGYEKLLVGIESNEKRKSFFPVFFGGINTRGESELFKDTLVDNYNITPKIDYTQDGEVIGHHYVLDPSKINTT